MRLQFTLLAQAASVPPDGLLYIHGGGINTVWTQKVPLGFQGTLVIRLLADRSEVDRPQQLEIQVNDSDGRPVIEAAQGPANLVIATGHNRNGILLAPITAELVADIVAARSGL